MNTTTKNVAIYWGAFNPPTLAHAQVIEKVLTETSIKHIIVNPSWEREDKKFGISPEKRKKLMQIFQEILKTSWNSVGLETHFLEWKHRWLTTTRKEEQFFREKLWVSPNFIFGNDVAPNMSWWSENEDRFIQERLQKIFIKRPGYEFDFKWSSFDNYMLLDIPWMLEISSSAARELIKNKQSVKWILHPEIEKSISENNISYN